MELKDTVDLMISTDYKEGFKAEYYQLKIRYDKLSNMMDSWNEGKLNFEPTCPKATYRDQLEGMLIYLKVLERRAELEGVVL